MGCDSRNYNNKLGCKRFNPRTRVGCDKPLDMSGKDAMVSIHAPVWGATATSKLSPMTVGFNPRTRVGCDNRCYKRDIWWRCFNPRTRVGCDMDRNLRSLLDLFQSTHPCGVRLTVTPPAGVSHVSIHAPVWGATFSASQKVTQAELVSIHAPVWGATRLFLDFLHLGLFQSTHPCGVRQRFKIVGGI